MPPRPPAAISVPFAVDPRHGDPADLVARPLPGDPVRRAVLVTPDRPALVLGSAQPETAADKVACAAAGVAVARRRSGGGAVFVAPGAQVWLDVFVPADDPLFEADVSRAAWWLGDLWAGSLEDAGVAGAVSHRGPMAAGAFGRAACFAGLGPGEVTVAGRKVVGISQRRDRHGSWLHTMACAGPGHGFLADLLDLPGDARAELAAHLAATTATVTVPLAGLEAALLGRLAAGVAD